MKTPLASIASLCTGLALLGVPLGTLKAATLIVTTTADGGTGSLRQTLQDAAPGDQITFAPGVTGTIVLTNGPLVVDRPVAILGPGPQALTISGNNASRVFFVDAPGVWLTGLSIAHGRVAGAAGEDATNGTAGNGGSVAGAGVWTTRAIAVTNCVFRDNIALGGNGGRGFGTANGGGGGEADSAAFYSPYESFTLVDCLFLNNLAQGGNGGLSQNAGGGPGGSALGGAFFATQTGLVLRCTFVGNDARPGPGGAGSPAGFVPVPSGGAIYCGEAVSLSLCTIVSNSAPNGYGGGVYNDGDLTMESCTLVGNSARFGGGIADRHSAPATGTTLRNTLVAGNTNETTGFGPDAYGRFTSSGFNLIGIWDSGMGTGFANGVNHDRVGSPESPLNPLVGRLLDNGGLTPTMALLAGSPALDAGHSGGYTNDQRGQPRPFDLAAVGNATGSDGSDIGAFEVTPAPLTRLVSNTYDSGNGSLRQALADGSAFFPDTIAFASNVTGVITLSNGPLVVNKPVTINGPGARTLSLKGNDSGPVFEITGSSAAISGLSITRGAGGLSVGPTSTLWLSECLIASNTDSGVTSEGTLIMNRCTVAGNSTTGAGYAPGGIATSGAAFITNSTISGNFGANGGGIFNLGALILANCTITDNDALYGGGIYNFPHQTLNPTTRCVSSLIAGNRAGTGSDVLGSFISGGFNLIGQTNDSAGWGATGDLPGRAGAPLLPLLGPLGDHGGPTPTHALLAGSPALDRGHANGLLSDERGFLRTVDLSGVANPLGGDGTDIGAYEFSPVALSITRLGGQVILGWPAWSEFLRLEVTASLPASNSWSAVNAPVVVSNGTNTVTVNATGDSRFYRLAPSAIPAGCTPAPVGLVAWWRAEENTADSRGNLHGTLQNGLGFTTGKVGQAFDFTAAGQSVRVPANPALDVGAGDGFTIEGWIHPA